MRIGTRTLIWIFAVLLALSLAASLILGRARGGAVANVYQDGVCVRSIDLRAVAAPYRVTVTDGHGHENVLLVEPGRIRVESANCPDQVCVNTGWISDGVRPIVCLPAKLSIRLERTAGTEEPEADAAVG